MRVKIIFILLFIIVLLQGCGNYINNKIILSNKSNLSFKDLNIKLSNQKISIGSYYYPGWSKDSKNWNITGKNIKTEFPDIEPLMGWNEIDTEKYMENEINLANNYGIDYFAFDWYWNFNENKEGLTQENINLEYALKNFLNVNQKMNFTLMWGNHFEMPSELSQYDELINYWKSNYFNNKNYLKTEEGKPVIYFFYHYTLVNSLGIENTKKLLKKIKEKTNAYIICNNDGKTDEYNLIKELGFDAISGWNYLPVHKNKFNNQNTDYSDYTQTVNNIWNNTDNVDIPVYPTVVPGWDNTAWSEKPYKIENSNPEEFKKLLLNAKVILENSNYDFKSITIQSWNEFGEGSYITPTKKWGYSYLEAIKNFRLI